MPKASLQRRVNGKGLLAGAAVLAVIVPVSLAFVAGGLEGLLEALKSSDPRRLAGAVAAIIAAEAVRAFRLVVIVGEAGYSISLRAALAARLIGRLVGLLTPGSVGSTPARAAIVGAYSGAPIGSSLGMVVLETLADSLLAALVALAASVPLLPSSLPVVAAALFMLALWSAGTAAAVSNRLAYEAYSRLGLPEGLACRIEAQRRLLVEALGEIRNTGFALKVAALTIAGFTVEAASVLVVLGELDPRLAPLALAGVSAAYVASVFPTPGGGGLVEVSLGVFLGARELVEWRLAQIAASLAPGVLVLAVIPSLREYVKGGALEGGGCPEGEDLRYARAPVRVRGGRG